MSPVRLPRLHARCWRSTRPRASPNRMSSGRRSVASPGAPRVARARSAASEGTSARSRFFRRASTRSPRSSGWRLPESCRSGSSGKRRRDRQATRSSPLAFSSSSAEAAGSDSAFAHPPSRRACEIRIELRHGLSGRALHRLPEVVGHPRSVVLLRGLSDAFEGFEHGSEQRPELSSHRRIPLLELVGLGNPGGDVLLGSGADLARVLVRLLQNQLGIVTGILE